jgi:TRAP-type transport system small permease protein
MVQRLIWKLLEWTVISVLGLMVVLVFGNVVLRYGFNSGIIFTEEVSRFLFVWMTFVGSVLTLRNNAHLGVQTLTKLLPLKWKKVCKFTSDTLTLICCILLTIGAWRVIDLNLVNIAPVSGIPLGVIYMACIICSVGMGVLLIDSIVRLLRGRMSEQEMCPDFDDKM